MLLCLPLMFSLQFQTRCWIQWFGWLHFSIWIVISFLGTFKREQIHYITYYKCCWNHKQFFLHTLKTVLRWTLFLTVTMYYQNMLTIVLSIKGSKPHSWFFFPICTLRGKFEQCAKKRMSCLCEKELLS